MEKKATAITTGVGTASYMHVHEAYASEEGKEKKFSLAFLWDKKNKAMTAALQACVEAAKEEGKKSKWNGKLPPASKLKLPIRDGDEEKPDDPTYAGKWFFNASSSQKPGVFDLSRNPIMDAQEVYSGIQVRLAVNFYPFCVSGNSGIAVGLNNIQKVADGVPLSGGASRTGDEFDDDFDGSEYADEAYEPKSKPASKSSKKPAVSDDDDDDMI